MSCDQLDDDCDLCTDPTCHCECHLDESEFSDACAAAGVVGERPRHGAVERGRVARGGERAMNEGSMDEPVATLAELRQQEATLDVVRCQKWLDEVEHEGHAWSYRGGDVWCNGYTYVEAVP